MKACSKSDSGAFIAGAITVVLGIFFWFPVGRGSVSLMPPMSLEGKTWVLHEAAPPRPEPARQSAAATGERSAKIEKDERSLSSRTRRKARLHRPAVASAPKVTEQEAPKPSSPQDAKENAPVAVSAVAPPGTLDPVQQYTMQELVDGFESDPSRYPLDRTVRSDGVALTLEGLQRREKLFVLKVAVANGTDADFFIKDFTVRAGATVLGSRSLFRILVEPQRVREGYVVFEKPQAGAVVQIKLKEDGGKGRSIESGVPYRF